jgi:acyl carrier protein
VRDTVETVRSYIMENVAWDGDPRDLTPTLPLIEAEVVDSVTLVGLIAFIEETYAVEIADDEIVVANFATLEAIAHLIDNKLSRER